MDNQNDNDSRLASSELWPSTCSFPDLPTPRTAHVTFLHQLSPANQFGASIPPKLVACGGLEGPRGVQEGSCCLNADASAECLVLNKVTSTWEPGVLGSLSQPRWRASLVSVSVGTYTLGGLGGQGTLKSSKVLFAGETTWRKGPTLPMTFYHGCAVAISPTRFLVMRRDSSTSSGSIREYDNGTELGPTDDGGWLPANTWPELLSLRYSMMGCAVIGSKLVVAGGSGNGGHQRSTEVINIEARTIEYGEDMLEQRTWFHLLPILDSDSSKSRLWGSCPRPGYLLFAKCVNHN